MTAILFSITYRDGSIDEHLDDQTAFETVFALWPDARVHQLPDDVRTIHDQGELVATIRPEAPA